MKVVLEKNIEHLGLIPEFRKKVQRAFMDKRGETFRVKWELFGWIRFIPRADGNYVGFLEKPDLQTTLSKMSSEGELTNAE